LYAGIKAWLADVSVAATATIATTGDDFCDLDYVTSTIYAVAPTAFPFFLLFFVPKL
jgi:hypothetical protein